MNIIINPFNKHINKVQRNIGQKSKANFSAIKNEKLRKRLQQMQNSLDYMTNHYQIDFYIHELPISKECFVTCQKGKKIAFSKDINAKDENSVIARKIYEAASEVL